MTWADSGRFPLWKARLRYAQLREEALQDAALQAPLKPRELQVAQKRLRPGTGLGIDHIAPSDMGAMPTEGWQDLTDLLQACESAASFPLQTLLNLMDAIPKPGGG